jgi:hypothetical protein
MNSLALFVWLMLMLSIGPVDAVILHSSGDPAYNTGAPDGSLTNSGWQYEGLWGAYLGTPIAPNIFIAAHHVGGQVGDSFYYRGIAYPVIAVTNEAGTDIDLWQICGTFPDYAPIYTNRDEIGKGMLVIGRGTQRGGMVLTTNTLGLVKTNGWLWGISDGVQRWGTNLVSGVAVNDGIEVLYAKFDPNGGLNECHLSVGDSSGGIFIKENSIWKLAGINYAVDGPYKTSSSGTAFYAAVFDEGGLYVQSGTHWVLRPDRPVNQASSFYVSRISTHADWIQSVLSTGIVVDLPVLQVSTKVTGPYVDQLMVINDVISKTLTIALPDSTRFYRLRNCEPLTIRSIQTQAGQLTIRYE